MFENKLLSIFMYHLISLLLLFVIIHYPLSYNISKIIFVNFVYFLFRVMIIYSK